MSETILTQEYIKNILNYDELTGEFTARLKRKNLNIGDKAGTIMQTGYVCLSIDDKKYTGHEIAWLYVTGKFPKETIDHIDGNRANNVFSNLREATYSQNSSNRGLQSNNTSGVKGVCWDKATNKWRARVKLNNKYINLGRFSDISKAEEVVRQAREKYHGAFARHS
jgi:hypothetical protein